MTNLWRMLRCRRIWTYISIENELAPSRLDLPAHFRVLLVQFLILIFLILGGLTSYLCWSTIPLSTSASSSSTSSSCPTPSPVSSGSMVASLDTATSTPTRWLVLLLILNQIDDLVRYSQVFDLPPKLAETLRVRQRGKCYTLFPLT